MLRDLPRHHQEIENWLSQRIAAFHPVYDDFLGVLPSRTRAQPISAYFRRIPRSRRRHYTAGGAHAPETQTEGILSERKPTAPASICWR
jgi:hypothetical protein